MSRADALIKEHLTRGSRIFVIGRTRGDVPRLAERLTDCVIARDERAETQPSDRAYLGMVQIECFGESSFDGGVVAEITLGAGDVHVRLRGLLMVAVLDR